MIPVVKVGSMTVSLQTYKQMPKVAKTPEGYTLKVNGKEMKAPDIALTGGGAHPMYTYIQWEGKATWFGGQLPSGTEITIETPSAVTVAPATKPEEPEQPKQGKKQK